MIKLPNILLISIDSPKKRFDINITPMKMRPWKGKAYDNSKFFKAKIHEPEPRTVRINTIPFKAKNSFSNDINSKLACLDASLDTRKIAIVKER